MPRREGGTAIRLWDHDYAYNPAHRRFRAWIACQSDDAIAPGDDYERTPAGVAVAGVLS